MLMEKIVSGLQEFLKGRVKFALLFGSALTEYFNKESDIDVAVYLGKPLDFRERLEFQNDLGRHFAYKREIDLVVLDDADPIIAMQVLANGRLIIDEDHLAFLKFKSVMISHYLDFKMDRRIIEEKIAEGSVYA
jgi:predicted nucleotidyltransferase